VSLLGWHELNGENPLLTVKEIADDESPLVVTSDVSMDVGLDWLNIAFDLNTDLSDLDGDIWKSSPKGGERLPGISYPELFANLEFGGASIAVTVNLIRFRCYVRFNPSRALYGKSMNLVSGDDAWLVVERLLDFLQPHVFGAFEFGDGEGEIRRHPDWRGEVWLTRVDCARNLKIDDPEQFKRLAASATPKHNPTVTSYDKKRGTWGLVHKTKAEGQDRLYDKSLELENLLREEELVQVDPDWFRFETQLQRDRLKRFGMMTVADLTQEKVWAAIEHRFAVTGWGVTLRSKGGVSKAINSLTPTDKMSLLGFIGMGRLGIEHEVSPGRRHKYSRMMRALGMTFDDPVDLGPVRGVVDIRLGMVKPIGG